MKGTDSAPTLDALAGVTASLVSDALDGLGLREHTVDQAIRPLVPGSTLVGLAVPVLIVPSSRIAQCRESGRSPDIALRAPGPA